MTVRIRVTAVGPQRIGRALSVIAERSSNLEPAFRVIADAIRERIADEIYSEGNGSWEPLSEEYAARKAVRWGPQPMLVASGALLNSLTVQGAPGHVEVIEKDRMRIGSTVEYLRYHQGTGSRQRIPRRAPINIGTEERRRWIVIIEDYIREQSR